MATVGYYSMQDGEGIASQVDEIVANGDTPVNVTELNAAQLGPLDSLYVFNSSNSGFGAEYLSSLAAVDAAVNDGMNLIIFDRRVTDADSILPGGGGIVANRDFSDARDVNVAAGAPASFTNGANGVIDDSTFDNGNLSNHGYVELSSLPAGAVPLLTTSDPTHIVAFTYPYGDGNVFYSTIPLDFYSGRNNAAITPTEIFTLFTNTSDTVCFTKGVLIATAQGPRPIEELAVGDDILVADGGTQTIRWIGSTRVSAADLQQNPKLYPVRITAGALGDGLPARDLTVSRQHRVLVTSKIAERMFGRSDALVAAIHLTALPGIFVDESVKEVAYYHMLFDKHEIVWAEQAACESLFTGPQALKSVPRAARHEMQTLFPELMSEDHAAVSDQFIPQGKQQKQLIARHLKNNKPVARAIRPRAA